MFGLMNHTTVAAGICSEVIAAKVLRIVSCHPNPKEHVHICIVQLQMMMISRNTTVVLQPEALANSLWKLDQATRQRLETQQ